MKLSIQYQSRRASRGAAALALAVTSFSFPAVLLAQTYVLTDLGTPGELESYATAINSSNLVVGYSVHDTGMGYRAWLWSASGARFELGGFGGSESRAIARDSKERIR